MACPWLFLWGCASQLVLCCQPGAGPSVHMAQSDLVLSSTHLCRLCSHLSTHTHARSLSLITASFQRRLSHTSIDCGVSCLQASWPTVLHFPSCNRRCPYLHRWQCRCCWRLFCTGPELGLCEGGGRSADPTETLIKDCDVISVIYSDVNFNTHQLTISPCYKNIFIAINIECLAAKWKLNSQHLSSHHWDKLKDPKQSFPSLLKVAFSKA